MSAVPKRFPVAVHLLLMQNGLVLLTRRQNTGYCDGSYSVVAGHLEGGEDLVQATVREALEEIGVEIAPSDVNLVGVMHRRSDEERIEFFLTAATWNGRIVNNEPEKCDDVQWFSPRELPVNTIPYIRKAISFSLARKPGLWFDEPDF